MPTRLEAISHHLGDNPSGSTHRFVLLVPSRLHWFEGHFVGNPILAAAVQLREIIALAGATWQDTTHLRRMTRLKFRRPIRPGQLIEVHLQRTEGSHRVSFEIDCEGFRCASGMLEFGA